MGKRLGLSVSGRFLEVAAIRGSTVQSQLWKVWVSGTTVHQSATLTLLLQGVKVLRPSNYLSLRQCLPHQFSPLAFRLLIKIYFYAFCENFMVVGPALRELWHFPQRWCGRNRRFPLNPLYIAPKTKFVIKPWETMLLTWNFCKIVIFIMMSQ